MRLIIHWIANALALLGIAYYVPGIEVRGFYSAFVAALVLGLVNALIRPFLLLITLPINILTLGLFTFVVNALMFWFTASVVKGFSVSGFWPAFWGALVLSIASSLMSWVLNRII